MLCADAEVKLGNGQAVLTPDETVWSGSAGDGSASRYRSTIRIVDRRVLWIAFKRNADPFI